VEQAGIRIGTPVVYRPNVVPLWGDRIAGTSVDDRAGCAVSSVVQLTPRAQPLPCPIDALESVTRAAFGQRRKMLRQSLKSLAPDSARLIAASNLPETARAEEVPIAGFVALANALARLRDGAAPREG
jgi:hypothetical protein